MLANHNIAFLSTDNLTGDEIFTIAEGYSVAAVYLVGPNLHLFGRLKELGRTPILALSLQELPADTFVYYRHPGYWASYFDDGSVGEIVLAVDSLSASIRLLSKFGEEFRRQWKVRPVTITPSKLPDHLLMIDEHNGSPRSELKSIDAQPRQPRSN
jgi:hypothetical protein